METPTLTTRDSTMKRKGVWLLAAVFLAAAGWFIYAPYHAVYRMREAAANRDPVALARYINFPSVRESLKANVNAKLLSEMSEKSKDNPFAVGAAFAMALVGPIVDAMVTPEALAMMMQGETPPLEKRKEKTLPRAPSPPASPPPATSQYPAPKTDISMHYESIDRFVVNARKGGTTREPVVFVLEREALFTWKLSAIRLPL